MQIILDGHPNRSSSQHYIHHTTYSYACYQTETWTLKGWNDLRVNFLNLCSTLIFRLGIYSEFLSTWATVKESSMAQRDGSVSSKHWFIPLHEFRFCSMIWTQQGVLDRETPRRDVAMRKTWHNHSPTGFEESGMHPPMKSHNEKGFQIWEDPGQIGRHSASELCTTLIQPIFIIKDTSQRTRKSWRKDKHDKSCKSKRTLASSSLKNKFDY